VGRLAVTDTHIDHINTLASSRVGTFKWLVDAIPALACYVDRSLRYQFMNTRYRNMFNIQESDNVSLLSMPNLLGAESFAKALPHVEKVLGGERVTYELLLKRNPEEDTVLQVHYVPDFLEDNQVDSGVIGFFMMGLDVTELRSTQANYHSELVKEVESKTEHLSEALEYLKKAQDLLIEQEKMASLGALVSGISHELNTPLGICLTAASHLQGENKKIKMQLKEQSLSPENLNGFLEQNTLITGMLIENVKRSINLINSFKELNLDQDEDVPTDLYVSKFLQDVVGLFAGTYKHVTYIQHVSDDLQVKTYPSLLIHILSSLIHNSNMHGFIEDTEYTITITANCQDKCLRLLYQDNGVGLSESAKKHIFDPFFTTNMSGDGTGLGMTVLYNLITQRLAGSIYVDRTLDTGFSVEINIPVL